MYNSNIKINEAWNTLIKLLTVQPHIEAKAVDFLLVESLTDLNEIIETIPHQDNHDFADKNGDDSPFTYYNPSKIPYDSRKTIMTLTAEDWDLHRYLRHNKGVEKLAYIREDIHKLYNTVFSKEGILNPSLINWEIMQMVQLIISKLPKYETKRSISQINTHQGLFYISRKSCIDEIDDLLASNKDNHVIIYGTAGMGKKMVAYEYVAAYPDYNVIWLELPTNNASLEEQLTSEICTIRKKTSFSSLNVDLSELLDFNSNIIIIERIFLDETDYSFIVENLRFTKAKLIILSAGIKLDKTEYAYKLPVLDNDSLWTIFQETIKLNTSSVDNANLITRDDFETILGYTGGNTLMITLLAKAVNKLRLDHNNKEEMRHLILRSNNTEDSSQLPYVSYSTPSGHRYHQPLERIMKDILIPLALKNNDHLSDFQTICFFVCGKCSMDVLKLFFDPSEIEATIKEVVSMGYANYTDNTELDVPPYISDAIWDSFNSKRSLEDATSYISRTNNFIISVPDIMLTDAPYIYSMLTTIYRRLTSLIPLIGGRDSRKAGRKVQQCWESYWDLLMKIYLFSYRVGNYKLANTVLDTIYSWNTSKGYKKTDNIEYRSEWELLHLASLMGEGNRDVILTQMDSIIDAQKTASYNSGFLPSFYSLYFDFIYHIISCNVIVLFNTAFIASKWSTQNTLKSFYSHIQGLSMPDDWKSFYSAYSIILSVINQIGIGTPYDTKKDMAHAQNLLIDIMLKSENQEISLSATFLFDASSIIFCYSIENKPNELAKLKDTAQSHIDTYGSNIEDKLVSKTLFDLYYITKIMLKTLAKNNEEIILSLPELIRSIEIQTSVDFEDKIILV